MFICPVILSAAALAATLAPNVSDLGTAPAPALPQSAPITVPYATVQPLTGIGANLAVWDQLRQTDSLSFTDYANFLISHPGWPGEARMRRLAEGKADPATASQALIAAFFARFPPTSTVGKARYADVLLSLGRGAEAREMARAAWIAGALPPDREASLLTRFGNGFSTIDQDQRMERLLSQRSTSAALRQLNAVSAARRPIYEARIALQTNRADAASLSDALGSTALRDPGFLIDRANWLRDSGQSVTARSMLATPLQLSGAPIDAEKWLETLLSYARGAYADNQGSYAYGIALNADKALPPGVDMRQQSLGVRDDYTSLVWLGGQAALKLTNQPNDAAILFDRYARAAQTPQTQTKGWYWAGRAALKAGDTVRANSYFAAAGQHGDQFYGQLAAERLGKQSGAFPAAPPIQIAPATRAAFQASELVQAIRYLGSQGRWQDQTTFIRTIAQNVKTDVDHVLAAELAQAMARPDLGVMVSRNWRNNGNSDPIRIGFPQLAVPGPQQGQWTIIHAITRQESQFDRQIVSHAGARGLMQLMPGTARDQAGKMGLPYDFERLTSDPSYNIMLGSAFFARLLDSFGGNYVLAVASYNAGPGNVRKWLAANGDPRMPGVDVVDWIEAIPFTETRGYVQRVLENAVVYDTLNPAGTLKPTQNRLSGYLGKSNPG